MLDERQVSSPFQSLLAKRATIVAKDRLADDLVETTLEAAGFRGVTWVPGEKSRWRWGLCSIRARTRPSSGTRSKGARGSSVICMARGLAQHGFVALKRAIRAIFLGLAGRGLVPTPRAVERRDEVHEITRGARSVFELPVPTPGIVVSAMWHPRMDADPAHRWLRETLFDVTRTGLAA